MVLSDIQTEVAARGFTFLSTTRLNYFINTAYRRLCEAEDWIWLQTTASGSAPKTIADLRTLMAVIDSTNDRPLTGIDRRTLLDTVDSDLTTTGTATYFYRTGDTEVSVYPVSTATFAFTYIQVPTDLSAAGDTPLVPARYHYALVDGAVIEAMKDSDNLAEAQALEANFQDVLDQMRQAYVYDHFTQDFQRVVGQDY